MIERLTRREALARAAGQAAAPLPRLAPREQLVNVLEYEAQARLVLPAAAADAIAGGDRAEFDRITLRPRMLVPVLDLDLSVTLLGDILEAPILIAPIGRQTFHPMASVPRCARVRRGAGDVSSQTCAVAGSPRRRRH